MPFIPSSHRAHGQALAGLAAAAFLATSIAPPSARAEDNIEGVAGLLTILHRFWDRRLYSGAARPGSRFTIAVPGGEFGDLRTQ